jgi:anti-sigma B factor antagonist
MSAHRPGSSAFRPSSARVSRARTEAIRRRLDRCYVVVHAPAELDMATAPAFAERLLAIEDNSDVVIDLRELQFCGSAGIAALLDVQRHAEAHDCTLTLSSPPPLLEHLLDICGLADHFDVRRPTPRRERRLGGADPARR